MIRQRLADYEAAWVQGTHQRLVDATDLESMRLFVRYVYTGTSRRWLLTMQLLSRRQALALRNRRVLLVLVGISMDNARGMVAWQLQHRWRSVRSPAAPKHLPSS